MGGGKKGGGGGGSRTEQGIAMIMTEMGEEGGREEERGKKITFAAP